MKKQSSTWLFVIAIVLLPLSVFGIVKWYEQAYQRLPVLGEKNHVISAFSLTDQHGQQKGINDWEKQIVVANFFFTHCGSICPKMMYQLKRVQAYAGKNIQLYSFTVDPERDSVQRLNKYADQFGIRDNWFLLTGDKRLLYRFARKDLLIVATDGDGGPNDFIHSEQLVLIDPQKHIRGYYKGTDEDDVNRLVKDIQKLKKE